MSNIKMITLASNPFESIDGIDATIQNVYFECISAIIKETDIRIALYMWSKWNGNEPDKIPTEIISRPSNIYERLKGKLRLSESNIKELIFDIDYSNSSNLDVFAQGLRNAGADVFYPRYKEPGEKGRWNFKMHNKTFLFNKLSFPEDAESNKLSLRRLAGKTIYNVVIQSSANIWPNQYTQANQVVIYYSECEDSEDAKGFYDYSIKQWDSIKNTIKLDTKPDSHFPIVKPESYTAQEQRIKDYALPRSEKNVYNSILKLIIKHNKDKSPESFSYKREIKIAMGLFSDLTIANSLIKISNMGISVKVISRDNVETEIGMSPNIKKLLSDSKVELALLFKKGVGHYSNMCHSKYMLYHGPYDLNGEGITDDYKITWAGSLNFEKSGLTRDSETLLRMVDEEQFEYLESNWDSLWKYKSKSH